MVDLESSIRKWRSFQEEKEEEKEEQGTEAILRAIAKQMELRGRKPYDIIEANIFYGKVYSISYPKGEMCYRSRFEGDFEKVCKELKEELKQYPQLDVSCKLRGNEFTILIKLKK